MMMINIMTLPIKYVYPNILFSSFLVEEIPSLQLTCIESLPGTKYKHQSKCSLCIFTYLIVTDERDPVNIPSEKM